MPAALSATPEEIRCSKNRGAFAPLSHPWDFITLELYISVMHLGNIFKVTDNMIHTKEWEIKRNPSGFVFLWIFLTRKGQAECFVYQNALIPWASALPLEYEAHFSWTLSTMYCIWGIFLRKKSCGTFICWYIDKRNSALNLKKKIIVLREMYF